MSAMKLFSNLLEITTLLYFHPQNHTSFEVNQFKKHYTPCGNVLFILIISQDPYERDWELGQARSLCGSCDNIADCACGLLSGKYKCSCPKGLYGSGYIGDCHGRY